MLRHITKHVNSGDGGGGDDDVGTLLYIDVGGARKKMERGK